MKNEIEKRCCKDTFYANAIFWNKHNGVVQCHACGHIYVKASKFKYFLNRFFKWW